MGITVPINEVSPSSRAFIRLGGSLCKLFRNAVQSTFNCKSILPKTLEQLEERENYVSNSPFSLWSKRESEANTVAVGSG